MKVFDTLYTLGVMTLHIGLLNLSYRVASLALLITYLKAYTTVK